MNDKYIMRNKYKPRISQIESIEILEGETIEQKIERLVENKEPIKDGAPEIFTERKEGVISAYNIRTDRFEIATEAMDIVAKSKLAKREGKAKSKVIKMDSKVEEIDEVKTIQGEEEKTS